jgi:cell division protease FtsH
MADKAPESTRRSQRPARPASEDGGKPAYSNTWAIGFLVLLMLMLWMWQQSPAMHGSAITYTQLWNEIDKKNVEWAEYRGEYLIGQFKDIPKGPDGNPLKLKFNLVQPLPGRDEKLLDALREHGARVDAKPQQVGFGFQFLSFIAASLITLGIIFYFLRRSSDPMSSGMVGNFIRSPAKRFKPSDQPTTFDDVAAMDQAKQELQEIVEFLKSPAKFQRLGAQIPKGVLLMGSPGTGKTLLARAVAGEAGVPFFSINGSEFIQMFVGVGASRVRDMFRTAKESAPCLLFIDEIDAVGRVRGAGMGGGHDEREQTLNQILSEMDGFQQTEAVIVIAATNRPDVLDPALLRPGRFDRHVTVDRPNKAGREAILKIHSRKVPLADDVDLAKVAAGSIGFSGAELKNLVNEAALHAARMNRDKVLGEDFEASRDKVLMGPRREEVLSQREREMTAYHEAGHALLAWFQPDVDPLHKVTVIPRGRALGVTQLLPNEDRMNIGEKRLHAQLAFMLGGRAAEKLIFNEYSAGAEDDLKRATQMARRMVSRWGMSDVIGPVAYRDTEEHPFLGKEYREQREYSEETARTIDAEVHKFLVQADQQSRRVLTEHQAQLEALTRALIEREALEQDDIAAVLGEPIPRSDAATAVNGAP